jgi:hypothetical protein
MRFCQKASILTLIVVCLAGFAAAQEITATITGTVTDETGGVLPGVTVTVKNTGTGLTKEVVTNGEGAYTASFLPVGRYEVTFTLAGFRTSTATNIALHVNDRLQLDKVLTAGGVTETVEISAAAQLVQRTPAVQNLMSQTQVNELPINNRNFAQLAALAPGVSSDLDDEAAPGLTSRVSLSINGMRRNAVNWLVDGASNVDAGSNITLLSTPTLESIEEFKVITSSYNAEWPRSGGGVINVSTKSGTNDFRGSAYEFMRNDRLNANRFFNKLSTNPAVSEHPPRLRYNNFGYTFGGPIKKEKLFFFWSEEWRRISRVGTDATANVPDPAFLSDPTNPNYVPPELRDPNAVRLLAAWPAPNIGTNRFVSTQPNVQDTRQEVLRVDYVVSPKWRLMGRYTHDLSQTQEAGGLFFNAVVPNVATTRTDVPGLVFVAQVLTTINTSTLNEFSYQLSGNDITTTNPDGTRNKKSDYGLTSNELFPENNAGYIPTLVFPGTNPSTVGASQLFGIHYRNHTVTDNVTLQRGNHALKVGGLFAFEMKDENGANETQGRFTFAAGGGFTAFQNFLMGNPNGQCGTACTYTEFERDVTVNFRTRRYEVYAQDSWKVRPNLTLDFGARYMYFPPVTDKNDVLTNFLPSAYNPANAPQFANATGSLLVVGTGDRLNGIIVAGQNSPFGRAVYPSDKNDIAPRLGFSWDPAKNGTTVVRGGYGVYYEQVTIGIPEESAFTNPPFVNSVTLQNAPLANPSAGVPPTTRGVPNLVAVFNDFQTPRSQQWNIGVSRQLYSKGVVEVGYVGSRGDHLIRPNALNQPQPADVVAVNGAANTVRPFLGYTSITTRQTTARSRYHGLIVNFRHDAGRNGLLNVAYTLSRNRADATNDRDAVDLPQNPQDLDAEYALARTDRTHIFIANYVYELPFFRNASGFLKATLGGWQVSGITTFQSGPPVSRIVTSSNGNRRGIRANRVGDPFADIPATPAARGPYWINPAAFAPPADGTYGDSGRAPFRLPGRNQWDVTLSKNWYPSPKSRLQFRADFINALNHTQFTLIDNACTASLTTCAVPGDTFGLVTAARLPREIQLGLKFYWN